MPPEIKLNNTFEIKHYGSTLMYYITNEIKFPATQNQDVTVKPAFPSIKDC